MLTICRARDYGTLTNTEVNTTARAEVSVPGPVSVSVPPDWTTQVLAWLGGASPFLDGKPHRMSQDVGSTLGLESEWVSLLSLMQSDAIDIACGNGGVHSSLSRAILIAQGREAAGGTGNLLAGEFLLQRRRSQPV